MEIAQEHLIYGNNPIKALRTITDSLMGCPDDLALRILKGDMVLPVDVDTQEVICQDRIPVVHDQYPKIDVLYYAQSNAGVIEDHTHDFIESFNILQNRIRYNSYKFSFSFDINSILKYCSGDDSGILDELEYDAEVNGIGALVKCAKIFIEKGMKTISILDWMIKNWGHDKNFMDDNKPFIENMCVNEDEYLVLYNRKLMSDCIMQVVQALQTTVDGSFKVDDIDEDNSLQNYIDASLEINKVLSTEIQPVNILDKYSAGWLSPEGDFYALNGEIANMLHNQIADALQEKGIVPSDEILDNHSKDAWLEQQGWVKIHGDNVQFGGCLNSQIGLINVDITNVQARLIYEYGQIACNGVLSMGWKRERISAVKFQMLYEANIPFLNKTYFEF
jgi:hypothetical protein